MSELGYQNPAVSDSQLESTLVNPGTTSSNTEVRRENVQVFTSHDRREMDEFQFMSAIERNQTNYTKRYYEKCSTFDRRGSIGRGTTR